MSSSRPRRNIRPPERFSPQLDSGEALEDDESVEEDALSIATDESLGGRAADDDGEDDGYDLKRAKREEYVKDDFVRDDDEIEYEEEDDEEEEEEDVPSESDSDEEEDDGEEDDGMDLDLDEGPIIPGNSPQLQWVPADIGGNDSLHDLMSVITEPGSIQPTDIASIESPNPSIN